MGLDSLGNLASVVGIVLAVAIAVFQRSLAFRAEQKAEAARNRATSLEEHLARQRWQQLRSLGEQIDALEKEGRETYEPSGAALHARLKEQYSALLGVVATSTQGFSAATIRHWVSIGRLARPWQIAEAISHLERSEELSEDDRWLAELIDARSIVPRPKEIVPPPEITEYAAAFILVADSVRDDLKALLYSGGQSAHSAAVLLDHLAMDCSEIGSLDRAGKPYFRSWGAIEGRPFRESFQYYESQDFWVMVAASTCVQEKLRGYSHLFEPGKDVNSKLLIPRANAVGLATKKYPRLPQLASMVFRPQKRS